MRYLLAAAVAALALLAAACGSGSSTSPTATAGRAATASPAPASSPTTAASPPGAAATTTGGATMTLADCKRTGEKQFSRAPDLFIDPNKKYVATVQLEKGTFQIELYAKDAPDTVNNFVFLACKGFYDGTTFHRVVRPPNAPQPFVAQGGDPQGTGAGGPGYTIKFESSNTPYTTGVIGMASRAAHSDTAGSQFFIALSDNTGLKPSDYATFGKVTEGMDLVQQITPRDPSTATTPGDKIVQVTVTEQ